MTDSLRSTYVEVNLDHILSNVKSIKGFLSPNTQFMAVIKAEAYGHGALPVAKALEGKVDSFGVAIVDEGIALREGGIKSLIHILGLTPPQEQEALFTYHLNPTVSRLEELQSLSNLSREIGRRIGVYLKVDTGMGRIGVLPKDFASFFHKLSLYPGVFLAGIMSHFSSADSDASFTCHQYQIFSSLTRGYPGMLHLANSAGLLLDTRYHLSMVRPGLILYGLWPNPKMKEEGKIDLKEALTWKTRIAHLKVLPANSPLSYGQTYHTTGEREIATLPLGYADGYFRKLSNQASVLVRGQRARVVGSICMDQFMVDVTGLNAAIGDEVVLLGRQGEDSILAEELASYLRTIHYEVLTGIGKRVPRKYVGRSR